MRGGEGVKEKFTPVLFYISALRPPPPLPVAMLSNRPTVRPASQPFIGRLGNLRALKRTKGNDGFVTVVRCRGARGGGVKGHRLRRPSDEKKNKKK